MSENLTMYQKRMKNIILKSKEIEHLLLVTGHNGLKNIDQIEDMLGL